MNKFFRFYKKNDFGVDYNFIFLTFNKFSALQLSIGWFDCGTWPFLQLSAGLNNLLSVLLCIGKFSISFDLFGNTWTDFTGEHND